MLPTTAPPDTSLVERWLSMDLDAWTRHVVRRHFDPATGSPYWLKRRDELDFDPFDIAHYAELSAFGPFARATLRDLDPVELVPQAVPRPLAGCVVDSGGITGRPCQVFRTGTMRTHHALWRRFGLVRAGFEPGRSWLHALPGGPHGAGEDAGQTAHLYASVVYGVDLDPRWIAQLIRACRLAEVNRYVDHVVDRMAELMGSRRIDYLETTPALFQALARRHPDRVARLDGVRLGGTQLTPPLYRDAVGALDGGLVGTSYAHTVGCAMGLAPERGGDLLPYVPPYPQVTMAVVDRNRPERTVAYGEVGQVRLTVLHEDLFLPHLLERDQAVRYRTSADWPCDGVANVQPLQVSRAAPEGLH
ncbi:arylcarboxylate reductase [Streptomyces sp. NPDC056411]|uniref:arylcarboxylate reductase n=1 Tax=Streptomyces sp. NPDC056411 TaxID=3345813 RepID=UPI0035DEDE18